MDQTSLNILGEHLKKLRQERGISLSKLAAAAGLAKSSLSRLEQGSGNPTLDTIWRLAVQLDEPFGNLVEPLNETLNDDDIQVRLIDQGKDAPNVDAYKMCCLPNALRKADAHAEGTKETITMISGELVVGAMGNTQRLTAGESYEFAADKPHMYQAGACGANLLLVVTYKSKEAL